jgi:hypothetical protein
MRKPAAALILIISLLITGLAVAEPSVDATKALERGDHTTVKALAEKGDARTQAILALIYLLGQGSPEDISGALGGGWAMKPVFIVLFSVILVIAIFVAISRWVFRINDIVNRQDNIVELLRQAQNTPS